MSSSLNMVNITLSPEKMETLSPTSCIFVSNASTNLDHMANTAPSSDVSPSAKSALKRPRTLSSNADSINMGSPSATTPELMRCKRRINFSQLGYSLPQAQPAAVARRNERERNRVKLVNLGFATLREHVPNGVKNKKMSKVETLRSAVDYIRELQQLLNENDSMIHATHAVLTTTNYVDSTSSSLSPLGMAPMSNENCYPRTATGAMPCQTNGSPACSVASSPTPSYASDSSSYEPFSPEEEELLDFTSWFS